MSRRTLSAVVAAAALALGGVARAGYDEAETSWAFTATSNRRHPARLELEVVVPEPIAGTLLCAVYMNNLPRANRGRVEINYVIRRTDGSGGNFRFVRRVQNNVATLPCVTIANQLERDDRVRFEFGMSRFQRLRRNRGDVFEASGAVFAGEQEAQRALSERLAAWRRAHPATTP